MAYTVPSNMVAVGNGKLKSVVNNGDKSTYEWFVSNPINNYNISVQIGNYVAVQDTFVKVIVLIILITMCLIIIKNLFQIILLNLKKL